MIFTLPIAPVTLKVPTAGAGWPGSAGEPGSAGGPGSAGWGVFLTYA